MKKLLFAALYLLLDAATLNTQANSNENIRSTFGVFDFSGIPKDVKENHTKYRTGIIVDQFEVEGLGSLNKEAISRELLDSQIQRIKFVIRDSNGELNRSLLEKALFPTEERNGIHIGITGKRLAKSAIKNVQSEWENIANKIFDVYAFESTGSDGKFVVLEDYTQMPTDRKGPIKLYYHGKLLGENKGELKRKFLERFLGNAYSMNTGNLVTRSVSKEGKGSITDIERIEIEIDNTGKNGSIYTRVVIVKQIAESQLLGTEHETGKLRIDKTTSGGEMNGEKWTGVIYDGVTKHKTKGSVIFKHDMGSESNKCLERKNSNNTISLGIENQNSFHPRLIFKKQKTGCGIEEKCQLVIVQQLDRTYFFDPYQIKQMNSKLENVNFRYFGDVELELPAESVKLTQWGTLIEITLPGKTNDFVLPIHSRYRLKGSTGQKTAKKEYIHESLAKPYCYWSCDGQQTPSLFLEENVLGVGIASDVLAELLHDKQHEIGTAMVQMHQKIGVSIELGKGVEGVNGANVEELVVRMPLPLDDLDSYAKWVTPFVVLTSTFVLGFVILKKRV